MPLVSRDPTTYDTYNLGNVHLSPQHSASNLQKVWRSLECSKTPGQRIGGLSPDQPHHTLNGSGHLWTTFSVELLPRLSGKLSALALI